jgi:tRNA(fMet)-specific endonuclease VapC
MAIRVVDTDVWSYIYKGRNEAKLYEPHLFGHILIVSFQTQAELIRWAISAGWSARRQQHLELRLQK